MPKTKARDPEVGAKLLKRGPGKSGVRHPHGTIGVQVDVVVIRAQDKFGVYVGKALANATNRQQVAEILVRHREDCKYSVDEDDKRFVVESATFIKEYKLHKLY